MSGGRTLETRTVWAGPTLHVQVDRVRLPNGETSELEVVHHPGATAVLPLRDDGTVLLVRQYRHTVGDWLLEVPAGKLSPGEEPEACARRELEEEAGVRAAEWREVKSLYTSPGFAEEEVTVFFATGLERVDPDPDEGEDLEIVEWPLADLDGAIDACADAKSLVGLLLFRRSTTG